jgi:serine/threonine protein kinase
MFLSDEAVARLRDAAARPDLPGGRYELKELAGRGGMGSVFVARDHLLRRDVAIKIAHPVIDGADPGVELESQILARLEHPGIVPIHDAGVTADGRVFYAMKLVRGRTLAAHLDEVPDLSARLSIFERVVEAVAFAHASSVVHRDLSPANVMIGGFGEVLVLDWGVAALLDGQADEDGLRRGTRGFTAPEQRNPGAERAHPALDVFSLGAILSTLIEGQPAPKRLAAIAAKCQADEPGLRYEDASALAADLARFRAGRPVVAYRDTVWDRALVWLSRYGVFAALVIAYLLMRAAFAVLSSR